MSNLDLLLEAERRGLVGPEHQGILFEARKRGLIPSALQPTHRQAEDLSMQALADNPPDMPRPSAITKESGGFIDRGTASAIGGTAGAVLGAPAGIVGLAAGGGLGAMAGSYVYDLAENTVRAAKGMIRRPESESLAETTKSAIGEGAWDVAATGAATVGKAVKRVAGKLFGTQTEEGRRLAAQSEREGIELGVQHVSPRKVVRAVPQVLGVFPFLGAPYRKGQARIVGQIDDRAATLLNELAPSELMYDVSKGMVGAAGKEFERTNKVAADLYDNFAKLADNLSAPDIVKTDPIKEAILGKLDPATGRLAGGMEQRTAREAVPLQSGETLRPPGTDPIGDWIERLKDLPLRLTVAQARGLERQINEMVRAVPAGQNFDTSRLFTIKRALEESKLSLDLSNVRPEEAAEVLTAWRSANDFFARTRRAFETPMAQKLGRVDRNLFNQQIFRPGSANADEIFDSLINSKSLDGLRDLKDLVGQTEFNRASRAYVERAYRSAIIPSKEGDIVPELFSTAKFKAKLGLGNKEGWAMFDEVLKGSGSRAADWRSFLDVAERASDIVIRSPSTFATRRAVLGAGLAGSIFMGGGHISLPAAALLSAAGNRGASFLMNPRHLKDLTRIATPNVPETQRRALALRLMSALARDHEPTKPFALDAPATPFQPGLRGPSTTPRTGSPENPPAP